MNIHPGINQVQAGGDLTGGDKHRKRPGGLRGGVSPVPFGEGAVADPFLPGELGGESVL